MHAHIKDTAMASRMPAIIHTWPTLTGLMLPWNFGVSLLTAKDFTSKDTDSLTLAVLFDSTLSSYCCPATCFLLSRLCYEQLGPTCYRHIYSWEGGHGRECV